MMTESTTAKKEIDRDQFSLLLHDLEDLRKDIGMRVYVQGGPLTKYFSNILVFTRHAIILNHMPTRSIKHIQSVREVLAFELNKSYKGFMAFTRYSVCASVEPAKVRQEGLDYA